MNQIYNVELCSFCQNACKYCPHSELVTPRQSNMSKDVWKHCLDWIDTFLQTAVCLNGFGEPLLSSILMDCIKDLNNIDISPYFSTNGELFTPKIAEQLSELSVEYISISPHTEKSRKLLVDVINTAWESSKSTPFLYGDKYPVNISISDGFRKLPHSWAGQVKGMVSPKWEWPCEFINESKCTILSDGTICQCCLDAKPLSGMGNIMDVDLSKLEPKRFSLCENCHQNGGV